ncbi:MAG: PEP-CTERM sorting domain-containing protein [Vicinamibacterales bacterium]
MTLRRLAPAGLVIALLLALPRAAAASPLTWEFVGSVEHITEPGWTTINLGDPFSWTVTFDTEAPNDPGCAAGSGLYFGAITGGSLTVGGYSWSGGSGSIEVNAPLGACGFGSGTTFRQFDWTGAPAGSRTPFEVVATLFYDPPLDGSLPTVPPPSLFVQVNGPIAGAGGPNGTAALAPPAVTAVPEPGTLALLLTGLGAGAHRRLRRRRTAA